MYYTLPTIISSIKTISSILFIQMPSKTDVVVFILRLLMWIYHLIFSIWYQFDILTRNCWIDFNAVGFDNVCSNKLFLLVYWCRFLVGSFFGCWQVQGNPFAISISEGVFLCSFTASSSHVLVFPSLIFCSIYHLTLPVFISTSSFIQILTCSCYIIRNLYCKLHIFMLRWCWAFSQYHLLHALPLFLLFNFEWVSTLGTPAFCVTGKLVSRYLFWLLLFFVLQVKSF